MSWSRAQGCLIRLPICQPVFAGACQAAIEWLSEARCHVYLQEALVPVPTQLFQGSLLLGSIASSVLGDDIMRNSNVLIHPLLIGGWCGLVSTALNSLPVGSLDGGKATQVTSWVSLASKMADMQAVHTEHKQESLYTTLCMQMPTVNLHIL